MCKLALVKIHGVSQIWWEWVEMSGVEWGIAQCVWTGSAGWLGLSFEPGYNDSVVGTDAVGVIVRKVVVLDRCFFSCE